MEPNRWLKQEKMLYIVRHPGLKNKFNCLTRALLDLSALVYVLQGTPLDKMQSESVEKSTVFIADYREKHTSNRTCPAGYEVEHFAVTIL